MWVFELVPTVSTLAGLVLCCSYSLAHRCTIREELEATDTASAHLDVLKKAGELANFIIPGGVSQSIGFRK